MMLSRATVLSLSKAHRNYLVDIESKFLQKWDRRERGEKCETKCELTFLSRFRILCSMMVLETGGVDYPELRQCQCNSRVNS